MVFSCCPSLRADGSDPALGAVGEHPVSASKRMVPGFCRLRMDGWDLPLDALSVEECADVIAKACQGR